jgi:hypothetical protein
MIDSSQRLLEFVVTNPTHRTCLNQRPVCDCGASGSTQAQSRPARLRPSAQIDPIDLLPYVIPPASPVRSSPNPTVAQRTKEHLTRPPEDHHQISRSWRCESSISHIMGKLLAASIGLQCPRGGDHPSHRTHLLCFACPTDPVPSILTCSPGSHVRLYLS